MTQRRPILGSAAGLIAIVLVASVGGCERKAPVKTTEAQQARSVRVTTVEARAITGVLAATGDLAPFEEAAVLPEVSGYRVAEVLVDEGAYVRAGQALARLDATLISSQLAQQTALAAQAAAQAEQAESQAARVTDLDGQGVVSQEQIEQRRFQARAARAVADAQAAAARDIRTRVGKLVVTAPVAGLVLDRTVRPGDMSAIGAATPWFRIARGGEIELEAQISETDLTQIQPGMTAVVTLPSGATAPGIVRLVSPQVDARTKLGSVRVRLPVRADIRAGGFARAQFAGATSLALTVPETAIRYDADGASVMEVGADNRVRRVSVQTGQRADGVVELLKGPLPGTRIVAAAAAFLIDGDRIRPVESGPGAAAGPRP